MNTFTAKEHALSRKTPGLLNQFIFNLYSKTALSSSGIRFAALDYFFDGQSFY